MGIRWKGKDGVDYDADAVTNSHLLYAHRLFSEREFLLRNDPSYPEHKRTRLLVLISGLMEEIAKRNLIPFPLRSDEQVRADIQQRRLLLSSSFPILDGSHTQTVPLPRLPPQLPSQLPRPSPSVQIIRHSTQEEQDAVYQRIVANIEEHGKRRRRAESGSAKSQPEEVQTKPRSSRHIVLPPRKEK